MEPPDRIERGGDGAFLPATDVRGMLAGDHEAPVDLAQMAVALGAGFLGPDAEAAERPGDAVPAHRNAAEEFLAVLRRDLRAPVERAADALLGRQRGQLVRGFPAGVGP